MRTLKISLLVISISIYGQTIQWQQTSIVAGNPIGSLISNSVGNVFASRWGDVYTGKIFRSTNMGDTWTLQSNGLLPSMFHLLAINSSDVLFAGGHEGINYSTNNGDTWATTSYPTLAGVVEIGIDFNDDIYFSASEGAGGYFYKSTDNGNSWILLTNGLGNYGVKGIAFSYDGYIYVTAYSSQILQSKIFYSANHGEYWYTSNSSLGNLSENIIVTINNDIYVTSYSENIYRSTNHGTSWDLVNSTIHNLTDLKTNQLGHIFVSSSTSGVFRSIDDGNSWEAINDGITELYLNSLTIDPSGFIYTGLGGTPGKIWRTIESSIPVELISFTAEVLEKEVQLNWSTATETNNSGFEILRSTKDNDWNKIGFVPGHGTTTETQHYSFTDNDVKSGKYQYTLKQIDYDGTFEYSQIVEVEIPFVNEFSLSQNYPNPFNPVTKIKFTIPTPPVSSPLLKGRTKEGFATLKVYDVLGNEIATLINEEKPAGEYEVEFDGSALTSGIYFYQLQAGQFLETKKMILLR